MENKDKPAVAIRLLAGGIAGASETIVTYPAEFIKTRRQLPQYTHTSISSLSILKNTYQSSGFSGFYTGCGALAISNALKSGIRFFSFEATRDFLDGVFKTGGVDKGRSPWVNIISGMSAGITESLMVVTPGEALKTRLIADADSKGARRFAGRGFMSAAVLVVREEGIKALWKGAVPVLSKQGTNSAVRFTSFGMMQEWIEKRWPDKKGHVGTTMIVGALSGIVTAYASMPFDNIKTRIQSGRIKYKGMLECAAVTWRGEGLGVFWRGTTPRLVRLTLSSSITFVVYDQVVQAAKLFQKRPSIELNTM